MREASPGRQLAVFRRQGDAMFRKLGLGKGVYTEEEAEQAKSSSAAGEDDEKSPELAYGELLNTFMRSMLETGSDFTNSFRCLSKFFQSF